MGMCVGMASFKLLLSSFLQAEKKICVKINVCNDSGKHPHYNPYKQVMVQSCKLDA